MTVRTSVTLSRAAARVLRDVDNRSAYLSRLLETTDRQHAVSVSILQSHGLRSDEIEAVVAAISDRWLYGSVKQFVADGIIDAWDHPRAPAIAAIARDHVDAAVALRDLAVEHARRA